MKCIFRANIKIAACNRLTSLTSLILKLYMLWHRQCDLQYYLLRCYLSYHMTCLIKIKLSHFLPVLKATLLATWHWHDLLIFITAYSIYQEFKYVTNFSNLLQYQFMSYQTIHVIIRKLSWQALIDTGVPIIGVWDDHDFGLDGGGKVGFIFLFYLITFISWLLQSKITSINN